MKQAIKLIFCVFDHNSRTHKKLNILKKTLIIFIEKNRPSHLHWNLHLHLHWKNTNNAIQKVKNCIFTSKNTKKLYL